MGYTTGRRLTKEFLESEAKKYNSRTEFINKDCSSYQTARRMGILDKICSHMSKNNFSIPQLICRQIFDRLLKNKSKYNDRKTIKPYELDIYYPNLKFAIEYRGKGWHKSKEAKNRDITKEEICKKNNIILFIISEKSRKYEEDIKEQISERIEEINANLNKEYSAKEIDNIKIDFEEIYNNCSHKYKLEGLKDAISECSNITDFAKKYVSIYNILLDTKKLHLLNPIRKKQKITNEELEDKCKEILDYHDFVSNHYKLYNIAHNRGLLDKVSSHMKNRIIYNTKDRVKEIAKKCLSRSHFKSVNGGAYRWALKNKIIEELFPKKLPNSVPLKIMDEEEIRKYAEKCSSRAEFRKSFFKACEDSRKLGIIDKLFPRKYKTNKKEKNE